MTIKYYIQIEIRYSIPRDNNLDENEYQQTGFKKFIHSELFDTLEECISYGNKIIRDNCWVEQYPGYQGLHLSKRFPLVAPSLKNGAQIYMKPEKLEIHDFDELNSELQKFNIPQITKKL